MVELHDDGLVEIEDVKRFLRRAEQAGCTLFGLTSNGHVRMARRQQHGGLLVYEVDEDDDNQVFSYDMRDYFDMLRHRGLIPPPDIAALYRRGLLTQSR